MLGKTTVEVGADGVAVVRINNPPLNLLSVDVMLSLKENIEGALLRDDVKAIVITGIKGKFSGGFNVTAFGGTQGKKSKIGYKYVVPLEILQPIYDNLRDRGCNSKEGAWISWFPLFTIAFCIVAARKPLVAAIEGPAFGGGLEIALACHARISTSSAQLGLTELQYGILPGLGGTQRLPRLVGLQKAIEMILMSKRVNGEEALSLSLVDAIAPADQLLAVARRWSLDIFKRTRPWVISLYKTDKLEPLKEARAILNSARLQVQRQNPNVMHPLVCIDVIEQGIVSSPYNALWKEAEALEELRESSTCRSLVHAFFAQRQILKIPGISEMNLPPRKINKVAVIGGGLMSSETVTMLTLRNYQVILKEENKENLLEEISRVKENLQSHVKNGKATQDVVENALSLLKGVLGYDKFEDVDLVIEAGSGSLSLKQESFAELEKCCPQHCIFTTTSSTFSLRSVGERTKCLNRIVLLLFCLPLGMPFMEIVRTKSTLPQVIIDLMDFGRKMKKTPIVASERKGYSVNCMFITYLLAAILLAERGVDVYQIDQALKSFGMQSGPFRTIDMVGFQAFVAINEMFVGSLPDRSYKSKMLSMLQHFGREGECNSKGFYKYDNCGKACPDPELKIYLKEATNVSAVGIDSKLTKLSDNEMVEMILFPALNEACRIIPEGLVIRSSDLDVASVLGLGFPAYRGGIIYWSNSFGSGYVCSRLEKWSEQYGDFFKPCDYIVERSAKRLSLANETKQTKSQL